MGPLQVSARMRRYFREAFKRGSSWSDISDQKTIDRSMGDINTLKDIIEAILRRAVETPPKLALSELNAGGIADKLKNQKLKDAQVTFAGICIAHLF